MIPESNSNYKKLPTFIRDLLSSPPRHGDGVHQWLFKVARLLHASRSSPDIEALLAAAVEDCGRSVTPREIAAAVSNSKAVAWQPGKRARPAAQSKRKPEINRKRIAEIVDGGHDLASLCETSPCRFDGATPGADYFIDHLFPGNPLLCIGASTYCFKTAHREDFRGRIDSYAMIVPSRMTEQYGKTKEGKQSMHTLSNTGPRDYLVCEFDKGTSDEQAAILLHLADYAPLVLVLTSGGKSLHGWFNCRNATEEEQHRFFEYAVSLGADPATWTRSQFVRLPQGWRKDKKTRQQVFYFNPAAAGLRSHG